MHDFNAQWYRFPKLEIDTLIPKPVILHIYSELDTRHLYFKSHTSSTPR